jgi:hypothetical protein
MAEKSCTIKTLVFPGPIPFTSWLMVYPGEKNQDLQGFYVLIPTSAAMKHVMLCALMLKIRSS